MTKGFFIIKAVQIFGFAQPLFLLWNYEFVAFTMDIYDFYFRVIFYDFAKFCDVNVHATSVVSGTFEPNGFECVVAFENVVCVLYEEREKVALFGCKFDYVVACGERLFLYVKSHATDLVFITIFVSFATDTAHDGFDAK